ncbi:MAG TPA: hypothetical protein DCS28_02950 [Candidatus Moranbacteria bacterium]|nr:hypothetical protein [Candidatus Moranbacteria bacterium]HAT74971.1 hypothetical protein [Candidatus Moranbacteria bacterium]
MNEKTYQKKIVVIATIALFVFLLSLSKDAIYQSETIVLFLPKNELIAQNLNPTVENFKQILLSLAFNDRLSDESGALEPGIELPNYKRKEFWNSKIDVSQLKKSGAISIKNFDANNNLAQELNNDTIDSLIAVAGNYYNIKTDLEIRIIDGPIVKKIAPRNIFAIIWQSILWAIGIYFLLFYFIPIAFFKKTNQRPIPGNDFSKNLTPKKTALSVFPEEENYFATKKNIFSFSNIPAFPTFGKKAPTPENLPISEETVPDIFKIKNIVKEKVEEKKEYTPREATAEEVKARLNKLLGGK